MEKYVVEGTEEGGRAEFSCPLQEYHPSSILMCLPTQKFSETPSFRGFYGGSIR